MERVASLTSADQGEIRQIPDRITHVDSVKVRWKDHWTADLDPFFADATLTDLQEMGERIETDLRKILEAHPERVPDADAEE